MEKRMELIWLVSISWTLLFSALTRVAIGGNVSYDARSLIINGGRQLLFSGSIHYPRSTPQTWPYLIAKAKEGGLDVIQTYVFWNLHEPQQGQYDFSGRRDIVTFIKQIQAQGLYVCLRIGPFIESEWNYGGFPFWLHDVPGIVYRTDNGPFKYYMQRFVTKIVNIMKEERLFASQGGPIILSQIENEYNMVEPAFGAQGQSYVRWAANMAVRLQTGVPWVMCKQNDAPESVINTCNGMRCGETFPGPNSPNKPSLWTENWTTFYDKFGEESRIRSPEDIAYQVALFIARNGSYVNYYMYHGGTNFGRTASSYVRTAYYDQAPLDEYGLLRQPKWGHLKDLHTAIKSCSVPLLWGAQSILFLGQRQTAYVFKAKSGECAAFLINNQTLDAKVIFQNLTYELPGNSISILPDCKKIAFNTAKINTQYNSRSMELQQKLASSTKWQQYSEAIPIFDQTSLRKNMLLEQMDTTKDNSDYLWYTMRVERDLSNARQMLNVTSRAHVLHVFVNGIFQGSAHGGHGNQVFSFGNTITLRKGVNYISLLSVMVGLPDAGAFLERRFAGLRRVRIEGRDYSTFLWGYKVGLLGEQLQIYTTLGSRNIKWNMLEGSTRQPLTWYKTEFDAPPGNDPVALNLGSMGKGEAWINGQSIGRYWVSFLTPQGQSSQKWYNIPRSFLKPRGNLLVLVEEETGNPLEISVDVISVNKICGDVSESHYPQIGSWSEGPSVQLNCPPEKTISKILFASFGTPIGNCQNYKYGSCHSSNSRAMVEQACLWKTSCSISLSALRLGGGDPCRGILKSLLVDAQCT